MSDLDNAESNGLGDDFSREAEILRSLATNPVELTDAPEGLWYMIASSIETDSATPESVITRRLPDREQIEGGHPKDRNGRRPLNTSLRLAAAACLVAIAVGVGVMIATRSSTESDTVATAQLTPYKGAEVGTARGKVEVVRRQGGQLRIQVEMHDLPPLEPGTFYEMWLINPAGGAPVSIASMRGESSDPSTTLDIPGSTDTSVYDVVDVSLQKDGSGPGHSGNSVLRGTLRS